MKLNLSICVSLIGFGAILLSPSFGSAQDISFIAGWDFDAGRKPRFVAVGDFNGDGLQDLAVANESSSDVSVLLGNGDGTFQAPRNFAVGDSPISIAVGDFNGDGVWDLAVAGSFGVGVLLGNGDGTFQAVRNFVAGVNPSSVAVGDFNGDGVQDLAVTNMGLDHDHLGTVCILFGHGDGTVQ